MTVADLIKALQAMPQDAVVVYHDEQDWTEVEDLDLGKAERGRNGLWYRGDRGGDIPAVRII